jgi:PRTRC genetic system protein E
MTTEPTGLFQGLAPLLANRTVILTVSANDTGQVTLNVIPKKVKEDESDALTTALCITASPDELDRDLPSQLREFTNVHAKAACNIQRVKDELAAAEKAEREAADEKRAKKAKAKTVSPASAPAKPQATLGLFDQCEPDAEDATADGGGRDGHVARATSQSSDYPD